MKVMKPYDFCGWATKNNLKCSDGRVIMKNAFIGNDGEEVPLVWNHQHKEIFNVLGHAVLENTEEGVRAYCYLNDTEQGQNAKLVLQNGDIKALSIYANQLKQEGNNVVHGDIKEVSMVISPANPGAFIDQITLAHGSDTETEAIIYTGEQIELYHAEEEPEEETNELTIDTKAVEDAVKAMSKEEQVELLTKIVDAIDEDGEEEEKEDEEEDPEGGEDMKHNAFDRTEETTNNVLSHADQVDILNMAKNSQVGTFQNALEIFAEKNGITIQHAGETADASGFVQATNVNGNVTWLFPEYKDVRPGAPELVTNDQGWVGVVINKVHKSPISRIRTGQVDIRNIDALRAKGYEKGNKKTIAGNFSLARRTTDPQTVYVKSALHRDDIIDIVDFDYVQYMYNINRTMLNEELATAIMLGDGREDGAEGKIDPVHIRPIWTDDELYTKHVDLDTTGTGLQGENTEGYFGENYIYAESMVNACLYSRENFKGTGTPDLFITPHMLNVMLLARDRNGRRIYASKAELASALNVGNIYTAEQFADKTRTVTVDGTEKTKKLLAIICNLADYSLGATKGGQITHFTQFDLDFNQEKSLLETRVSGALTRIYSAIAIEEDVTAAAGDGDGGNG